MSNYLSKIFSKSINHPWQSFEDETIVIDPSKQFSYEFGHVGTFIWNQINGSASLDQILQNLCAEYEVKPDEAQQDLNEFIEQLQNEQLIIEIL